MGVCNPPPPPRSGLKMALKFGLFPAPGRATTSNFNWGCRLRAHMTTPLVGGVVRTRLVDGGGNLSKRKR